VFEHATLDIVLPVILTIGYERQSTQTQLARDLGITYSWLATSLIPELLKRKFIEKKFEGRKKLLTLTLKGEKLFRCFQKMEIILK
jgi:DNA-binding MarR family transcriptional regulator